MLTSRPTQYRAALDQGRLYGAAVVELLEVAIDQAEAFLLAEQLGARRAAWQYVVDQLRRNPNSVAARTLTNPLALSLARDTYLGESSGEDPKALLNIRAYPTPEALRRHLLARFICRAYPEQDEREHASRWLAWIAHQLGASRDLLWWEIPSWTPFRRFTGGLIGLHGIWRRGSAGVRAGAWAGGRARARARD